jgi:hypothetical protein
LHGATEKAQGGSSDRLTPPAVIFFAPSQRILRFSVTVVLTEDKRKRFNFPRLIEKHRRTLISSMLACRHITWKHLQNAPPFCIVTAPPLRLTFGKAFGVYETRAGNRKITHAAIRQTTGKPFTLHFNCDCVSDYCGHRAG